MIREARGKEMSIGANVSLHPLLINQDPVNLSGYKVCRVLLVCPSEVTTSVSQVIKVIVGDALIKVLHMRRPVDVTTHLISRVS